jgi:glutamate-1-semialdehyde 2,1-aminomutase
MDQIAPLGPVYQAGTLSGNPLAVAAGIAMLNALKEINPYDELESRASELERGLKDAAGSAGIPTTINRVGSMMTAFFVEGEVTDWSNASRADTMRYASYFRAMLEEGIYLAPSQFECAFVSLSHTSEVIEQTVEAAFKAMKLLAG